MAHFKTSPKIVDLLGSSYRNAETALRELVDNAWDADADTVWITLPTDSPADPQAYSLTIRDNGIGMSRQQVENEYLYIANNRHDQRGDFTPEHERPVK